MCFFSVRIVFQFCMTNLPSYDLYMIFGLWTGHVFRIFKKTHWCFDKIEIMKGTCKIMCKRCCRTLFMIF